MCLKKNKENLVKLSMFFTWINEGLDGGSWHSLITKNFGIYSLSLKFWLIH